MARLDDASLFHHINAVGIDDRVEPVSDHHSRDPFELVGDAITDDRLRHVIKRTGCLVKEQDLGSARDGRAIKSRWRWPLDKLPPASPTMVNIAIGIRRMSSSRPARRAAPGVVEVQVRGEPDDVVENITRHELRILHDHPDLTTDVARVERGRARGHRR